MIPFGGETVTLIRRTEATVNGRTQASYQSYTLSECSWRRSNEMRMDGNGVKGDRTVTCRVPADQEAPRPGDLLILGRYAGTVSSAADYKRIVDATKADGSAFVVEEVTDNTRGGSPMPHWKAR